MTPLLGDAEEPDPDLAATYAALYPAYREAREALTPVWKSLAATRNAHG